MSTEENQNIMKTLQEVLKDSSDFMIKLNNLTLTPEEGYFSFLIIRQYLAQNNDVNQFIGYIFAKNIHNRLALYLQALLETTSTYLNALTNIEVTVIHELLWIFTNLCSGTAEQSKAMLNLGAYQISRCCLYNYKSYPELIAITFELIGNLVGEEIADIKCVYLNDPNFYKFYLQEYQSYIFHDLTNNFEEIITWTLSNCFRNLKKLSIGTNLLTSQSYSMLTEKYIEALMKMAVFPFKRQASKINLLWTFNYITADLDHMSNDLIYKVYEIIKGLLINANKTIETTSLRIFGNLIANSELGVSLALQDQHFINLIFERLKGSKNKIKKECAWILSNIMAGTPQQVDLLMKNPIIFNQLHLLLTTPGLHVHIFREICWSISNLTSSCSESALQGLFYSRIMETLAKAFSFYAISEHIVHKVFIEGVVHLTEKLEATVQKNWNVEVLKSHYCAIHAALGHIVLVNHNLQGMASEIVTRFQCLIDIKNDEVQDLAAAVDALNMN